MDERQKKTYDAIVARCTDLIPSVDITKHIKQGTLRVANNTLDGITFEAVDPADLEAELSGRMKLPGAGKLPKPGVGRPLVRHDARASPGQRVDDQHEGRSRALGPEGVVRRDRR